MNAQSKITACPAVYAAIAAVQGELARHGIAKDSENTFDRYKFRGIDAVYNALAPLLAKHGLCVMPRMIERDCQERVSRKGEPMFYVTVTAEFDFVAASDGSCHTVRTYGEAMDRSDKATNKAMSAAYKYAAFMAFAIPTEGDNDAGDSSAELAARERIDEATLTNIIALCEAIGGNQAALACNAFGVEALPDLTPAQGIKVLKRLNDKLAEKAKAATNTNAEMTDA